MASSNAFSLHQRRGKPKFAIFQYTTILFENRDLLYLLSFSLCCLFSFLFSFFLCFSIWSLLFSLPSFSLPILFHVPSPLSSFLAFFPLSHAPLSHLSLASLSIGLTLLVFHSFFPFHSPLPPLSRGS